MAKPSLPRGANIPQPQKSLGTAQRSLCTAHQCCDLGVQLFLIPDPGTALGPGGTSASAPTHRGRASPPRPRDTFQVSSAPARPSGPPVLPGSSRATETAQCHKHGWDSQKTAASGKACGNVEATEPGHRGGWPWGQ